MSAFLLLLPYWRWAAIPAVLLALGYSVWRWDDTRLQNAWQAGYGKAFAEWQAADTQREVYAVKAVELARLRQAEMAKTLKESADANEAELQRLRSDAVIADAASGRLRARYAALLGAYRGKAIASAAAEPSGGGDAERDPGGLQAAVDVFGRCEETVRLLAEFADRRGAKLSACAREHQASVTASQPQTDGVGP